MTKLNRLMASKNHPRPREPRGRAAPRVIEDKTTALVLPSVRPRWDVVMLSPQANEGTLSRITAAGFDVWRPRTVVQVSAASIGKAAWVNRPLWPRYAFLGRNDGCPSPSDVPFVGRVLIVGSLSGAAVDAIARREEAGEFDCRTTPLAGFSFAEGAHVEALDGLLSGIVRKSDEERTVVLFRLMEKDHVVTVETRRLRERA